MSLPVYVQGPLSPYDVDDTVVSALKNAHYDEDGRKVLEYYFTYDNVLRDILEAKFEQESDFDIETFADEYADKFFGEKAVDDDADVVADDIIERDHELAMESGFDENEVESQLRGVARQVMDYMSADKEEAKAFVLKVNNETK